MGKSGMVYLTILLGCLFFHFHVMHFVEGATLKYISAFVVKFLGWKNKTGALVATVFIGAMGIGRLCNIGIAVLLSPRTMLVMNLSLTLCSYILMCFVEHSDVIVWLSVAMAGFFQSSTLATMMLWAAGYIRVTGFASGVFVMGVSTAEAVFPLIVGKIFDREETSRKTECRRRREIIQDKLH